MERYVIGGAIGVYEKGGAEEMEPGEAPAVSVLILIWRITRFAVPIPRCKIQVCTFDEPSQRRFRT